MLNLFLAIPIELMQQFSVFPVKASFSHDLKPNIEDISRKITVADSARSDFETALLVIKPHHSVFRSKIEYSLTGKSLKNIAKTGQETVVVQINLSSILIVAVQRR
jgi:hypothetical protein